MSQVNSFRELIVYQKAYALATEIFELSKSFPKEEKYSLTDQIRRSSRSVSANLAEAYAKRRYEAHFVSKLTDAYMENSETQVWLKFALESKYIQFDIYNEFAEQSKDVGRLLNYMINNPKKFSIIS
jgi:four helix bundle protein